MKYHSIIKVSSLAPSCNYIVWISFYSYLPSLLSEIKYSIFLNISTAV